MSNKKVLVVEDRPDYLKTAEGIENVECVSCFMDALSVLRSDSENIQALLTDVHIPYKTVTPEMRNFMTPETIEWYTKPEALGVPLFLEAIVRKIPLIGIVTENSHHEGSFPAYIEDGIQGMFDNITYSHGRTYGNILESFVGCITRASERFGGRSNKNYSEVLKTMNEMYEKLKQ